MVNIQLTRAERMRQKEALLQHRARLTSMLTQKLNGKYGFCKEAKSIINTEISSFMANTYQIEDKDLEALEIRIGKKTENVRNNKRTVSLADTTQQVESSPKVEESKVLSAKTVDKNPPQEMKVEDKKKWLQSASEWQLLDAYQAIENEEHKKCCTQIAKKKQETFKKMLDEQLEIRRRGPKSENCSDETAQSQKKLLEEWKKEKQLERERIQNKYLREKEERDRQVAQRRQAEQRERDEKRAQETAQIQAILRAEQAEKEAQTHKKKEERQRLLRIQEETRKEQCKRKEEKQFESVQDQAMMEAYKAKLEAEEEARQTAFSRRMARLAHFTNKSSTEGAGYNLQQANRRAEERILIEAKRKEEADLERERRDNENLRRKQYEIAMENKRLAELKKIQEKKAHDDEQTFSKRYVRESQEYLAAEAKKMAEMRVHMQKHALELEQQMHQAKNKDNSIHMDPRERAFNRRLLAKITSDDDIVEKLQSRLSPTRSSAATSRAY